MQETDFQVLFADNYLLSLWKDEWEDYIQKHDNNVLDVLKKWSEKDFQKETIAESAFIDTFFKKIWNHTASGETKKEEGYTSYPQYPIQGAGQRGGTGKADLALGYFGTEEVISQIPQVLCEFKDINSGLDNSQSRKGNSRSPVKQCADYLKESFQALYGNEPVLPSWGIVTDMNEFRLYHRKGIPFRFQRFFLKTKIQDETSLLDKSERGQEKRFLFWKIFQPDVLLSKSGKSFLEKQLDKQIVLEKEIENDFYKEYKSYRKLIFETLVEYNPDFQGTKGRLVRLTQRFLDRCIFLFFCEDMGKELNFPRNIFRDLLIKESKDEDYDPKDDVIWTRVKKLFESMREGKPFRNIPINKFNGGLFEKEPELESLHIPSFVFCKKNQGTNEESIFSEVNTALYFSAKYNFGVTEKTHEKSISLITLGRIFEQSITELEIMEAHADGKVSLNELSKRKTNGVYYTPEWVTQNIVEETVGRVLEKIKQNLKLNEYNSISEEDIKAYQKTIGKKKTKHHFLQNYVYALDEYAEKMKEIKVIDPACGSGAFLIQAYQFLLRERQWIANERERIDGMKMIFDSDRVIKDILSNNIYGIDINTESVEITRLAIWLHTARPDSELTSLDKNIVCGNTLIGKDFYKRETDEHGTFSLFSEEKKEEINVFDWKEAFPEIAANGGFHCVIGNPPYVKLQNFQKKQPEMTEFLLNHRVEDKPIYESTQTGNFDLYLPFIEKGLELLHPEGRMGYIAPSVWTVNEYGEGLRKKLIQTRQLERWVDFKSYQVFTEATTYTSLQYFTKKPNENIKLYFAYDGDISNIDWERKNIDIIWYKELSNNDAWLFADKIAIKILKKLSNLPKLLTKAKYISQGLISGSYSIFVLKKADNNLYKSVHNKDNSKQLYNIEDEIMKAILTGENINRYIIPNENDHIIFPYEKNGNKIILISFENLKTKYPLCFKYLSNFEKSLRKRDSGKLNDSQWFRFSRNQNLDKQNLPKLMISGTATELRVIADEKGSFSANDKRVYSIFFDDHINLFFFLGILNAPVASYVFKKIARPKANGYFDVETQYLSPLPIPNVTDEQKKTVGDLAQKLQEIHTERRDKILMIEKRLSSSQTEEDKKKPTYFWKEAKDKKFLEDKYDAISLALPKGAKLEAKEEYGEIKLFSNGLPVLEGIFEEETTAKFIAAQWNLYARQTNVTEKFDGKKLISGLLKLRKTDNQAIIKQVIKIEEELQQLENTIDEKEKEMNEIVYGLYGLTEEEIKVVEKG